MDHEAIARQLLTPIWQGIDADYKRKYRNIWQQFEDQLRSAAYTSSLAKFFAAITTKMGVRISERHTERLTRFMSEADNKQTLRMLRDETVLLVLYVRVENEERKNTRNEIRSLFNQQ